MKKYLLALASLILSGCMGYPDSVKPVENFELEKYLGNWYEIARLDHSFERGMDQVTANYSLRDDGGVRVKNRGFLTAKNKWKEAEGKAYFADKTNEGYLKVSFFGPFYGSYVVFELDQENYQHAFVIGPNTSYLWFLSRTPVVTPELKERFIEKAKALGINSNEIIFVNQQGKYSSGAL